MTERTHQVRRGRVAEAERNDASILTAARSVFIFDPKAPISEVAKRAGVGIGALYSRYGSKENLLATLCELGQQTYLTEVERALASDEDPGEAYFGFLRRIVDADTHSLTVHLAGMFTPTERHIAKAERMRELGDDLFDRAQRAGAVRPDVTNLDVAFLLEMIAKTSIGDEERTAEVRQRQLAVVIDGLRSPDRQPLPGQPPTWEEQSARWMR
jgi:AcrR family transcriptional regulator